jgi:tetratricopeptide (TPR) repeat protein
MLWARVVALEKLGRTEEAYEAAGALIQALDPGQTEIQRRYLIQARVAIGRVLFQLDRYEEARIALDDAVVQCARTDAGVLSGLLAVALGSRGETFATLGSKAEALRDYTDVVVRFKGTSDPVIGPVVRDAERQIDVLRRRRGLVR